MYRFHKNVTITLSLVLALGTLHAQTVDEVIDKYITSLGGQAKLKALRSLSITGVLRIQGFDMGIKSTILNKVGIRTDITVPDAGTGYQIITPTKGWTFMPFSGQVKPQALTADQVSAAQANLDLQGPLLNYKQKGHKAELLGTEMVDSLTCYKIKLTYKTGNIAYYFIDDQSYYRVKMVTTETVNGMLMEKATTYSDFRRTPAGYLIPYKQTNSNGTMEVSMVTVNPPVKPGIFVVK
jgi:hypothetical protein